MHRLWTLVLVLGLATGCGTNGDERADATDVTYGSVYDIREIVESNGLTCDTWDATEFEESGDYARQAADCTRTVAFSV